MRNKKFWAILIAVFFIAGVAGSYFIMRSMNWPEKQPPLSTADSPLMEPGDISVLRIYLPRNSRLDLTEIKIPKRISSTGIAEAVIEEFFKQALPEGSSSIPRGVKLRGLYNDEGQMLYIDLSDEVRRNFQGDALSEYLLLKGLYESLVSNVQDFHDVKILVEGKEIETLGGHFHLKYPLKNTFSVETKGDSTVQNEE
jgi:hypothetical protein